MPPRSIFDLSWSADGQWLAYAVSTSANARTSAVRICDVRSRRVHEVTRGLTRDTSPAFDPAGRYLAFLSTRSLRPVEDEVYWQLNFARVRRLGSRSSRTNAPRSVPIRPDPSRSVPAPRRCAPMRADARRCAPMRADARRCAPTRPDGPEKIPDEDLT